jgi:excisionase family DNA binding protein
MDADAPDFLTTREVAALLRVRERKIYDMAAAGEIPCRRLIGKLLFPRAEIEAWLTGGGPRTAPGAAPAGGEPPEVLAGSHDPLLDWAIRESGSGLATFFDGSLDGLDRLAEGRACAAGLHLFEADAGRWNVDAAAARLGGAPVVLLGWAARRRGLILGAGVAARTLADLRGLRIVRRQPTAGAGLWLDRALGDAGLSGAVAWTDALARTETEAAEAVARGAADAAPGLEGSARPFGLGFLPLVDEAYDIAVDRRAYFEPPLQRLFAFARSAACAERAAALGGYDLAPLGLVRWNG